MKNVLHPLKTTLIFSVIMLVQITVCYSQDMPKVIPPSPETAQLFKYLDYPVDQSTGVPQVSVPIYEVKSGSLSVPISLSYHASGRKVTDQDGPVALGWSLNASGMISRTIYGNADFGTGSYGTYYFPYPFKVYNFDRLNDLQYLEKIMHFEKTGETDYQFIPKTSFLDAEYDVFSYSFNNNSGKFIFKDSNNVKTPALLPYKPYIITPHYTIYGLTSIDIIDDKGVFYHFVGTETYSKSNDHAISGYALDKMISADKSDSITFEYDGFIEHRISAYETITLTDAWEMESETPPDIFGGGISTNTDDYQISRLKKINFRQGKVLFNLVTGSDKIDNIQIVNLNNEVIKTIQLNRSICDASSDGVGTNNKLDSLTFKDNAGIAVENYRFQYYPTIYPNNTSQIDISNCDWWGYYNASGVHSMVPYYSNVAYLNPGLNTAISVGNPSTNREPNLEAAKSGVLKKITYPTGGSTEFLYEPNKYGTYNGAQFVIKDGPGLRIAQINNVDNNTVLNIKTFKYGTGESGYGSIDLLPGIGTMSSEVDYAYYLFPTVSPMRGGTYRYRTFSSGFIPELSALADRPVIYTQVTEYHGTQDNNIGKTICSYDYYPWSPAGMPAAENLAIPKMHIYDYNYWNNPSLVSQADYKVLNNGGGASYQKVKEVINQYTLTTLENVKGLHVQRVHVMPQYGNVLVDDPTTGAYVEKWASGGGGTEGGPQFSIYTASDYQIPVGFKNLMSTTENIYNDDNSVVSNTQSFTYNSKQFISNKLQSSSDGISLSTDYKYPFDNNSDPLMSQMTSPSLNMLDYIIEQNVSKNSAPLSSLKTTYYNWNSSQPFIAPVTVSAKKGTSDYETRIRYYGYDFANGSPLSISKENDVKMSYIWDYNKTYPIAEVTNGDISETAYTSFEADGTGNWTGINTANIQTESSTISGSKSYNFIGTSLSKTGLDINNTYVVSYWCKSASPYSVTGLAKTGGWPKNLRTVSLNGVTWYYWEHRVYSTTSIAVSGTGVVDELRLYPENAQMTTYTYLPLVGISSKADLNGRATYYEYDGFGRLKLVRDMNGNIIKQLNYKYQAPIQ